MNWQKLVSVQALKALFGRAYAVSSIVAIIGTTIIITAFLYILSRENAAIAKTQIADSRAAIQIVRNAIDDNVEALESLNAFIDASASVTKMEFSLFATPLLAKHGSLHAIAWLPKVPHSQRLEFDEKARLDGLHNTVFREEAGSSKVIHAQTQKQYIPVYSFISLLSDTNTLGFDITSDPKRYSTALAPSISGTVIASPPTTPMSEDSADVAVTGFSPVHSRSRVGVGRSIGSVLGILQMALHTDALVTRVVDDTSALRYNPIQDVTNLRNDVDIFGEKITAIRNLLSEFIDSTARSWRVETELEIMNGPVRSSFWLLLVGALAFFGLLILVLVQISRRREVAVTIEEQRSADLKMFSSIAANSNDLFVVTNANDLEKNGGGPEIVYVNEAFTRLTGYTYDESVGQSPRFLQGKDTSREQLDLIREALQKGKPFMGELLNYTKNNEEYWIDLNIAPIRDDSGKVVQFSAVERDITERKNAQIERESLISELSVSNEELERFAYVCSHDLQEPLRMIRSFSDKLQTHIGDGLDNDEKGKRYFQFITDGATRAQDLINDILTYSSINNDAHQLQRVSAQELVASIIESMQLTIEHDNVSFTHDALPELWGNKTQLYQLFQNLISNAVKYRQTSVNARVHLGVIDSGMFWQFSMKDNGIGIEERHLGKIFDVFQRLHPRGQYAGTGVGLAICKKVVSRHGGRLWVESEPGVGTTFYFTLVKPAV